MKGRKQSWVTKIFLLLTLPYLVTVFVNGPEAVAVNKTTDMENILPIILSEQISPEYRIETLEAQAVIARSNLMRNRSRRGHPRDHLLSAGARTQFRRAQTSARRASDDRSFPCFAAGRRRDVPRLVLLHAQADRGRAAGNGDRLSRPAWGGSRSGIGSFRRTFPFGEECLSRRFCPYLLILPPWAASVRTRRMA